MIKACVFDLDGTLLDTLASIRHFVNIYMQKYKLKSLGESETRAFVGDGARLLIERALRNSGFDTDSPEGKALLDTILPSYVRDYNDDPYYLTEPYPGIMEAIRALSECGMKLGVLSNKPDPTVKQLAEKYFPGMFTAVRGAVDSVPLKPSPESAFLICREMGVKPDEVAYFGDTAVDVRTAKAFGAGLSVAVLWGFRTEAELAAENPDILLSSASQICEKIIPKGSNQ